MTVYHIVSTLSPWQSMCGFFPSVFHLPSHDKDGQCEFSVAFFFSSFYSVGPHIGHQSKIQHSYLSTFIFILFTQPFLGRHKQNQENEEVNRDKSRNNTPTAKKKLILFFFLVLCCFRSLRIDWTVRACCLSAGKIEITS